MNNSELRDTTMINMVRFAIMVLMAFRDLRFLSTVFLAHFTRLISFPLSNASIFYSGSVFEKPGSSNKASRVASIVCSLRYVFVRVQLNWLFREVTTVMEQPVDRKSTRLNSSHVKISYAVFCLKKKKK